MVALSARARRLSLPRFGEWEEDEGKMKQRYSAHFKSAHARRLTDLGLSSEDDGEEVDVQGADVHVEFPEPTRRKRHDRDENHQAADKERNFATTKAFVHDKLGLDLDLLSSRANVDVRRISKMVSRMNEVDHSAAPPSSQRGSATEAPQNASEVTEGRRQKMQRMIDALRCRLSLRRKYSELRFSLPRAATYSPSWRAW